ncbi:hypothetical protein [Frankia sp. QA3]|uniref:hypothetical protein n=1 Tax=Frankia sp. QA3 TaxID=710111 RepID=UPI00030650D7|nr:hypothetical protein [Frankia sp. QA3]
MAAAMNQFHLRGFNGYEVRDITEAAGLPHSRAIRKQVGQGLATVFGPLSPALVDATAVSA